MEKFEIGAGRTIEDAVNDALSKLGADRDMANIEVLETPSKGFLGIGATPAKVKVTIELPDEDPAKNFLEGVFRKMGVDIQVESGKDDEGNVKIVLSGDSSGLIIGKRGETLDALQYLTSLVVNHGREDYVRVSLDSENYREKRQATLQKLAKRLAATVARTGKNITLEPMNPSERRIIHATLQKYRNITTYSVGVEPNRKLVVAYNGPKKEASFERPHRSGGYRNENRSSYADRAKPENTEN